MDLLDRINLVIDAVVKWILMVLMSFIPGIMIFQVVVRYVFNSPLTWSEEAVRYAFVWLVFMSACAALMRGEVVSLDYVLNLLGKKIAFVLVLIGRICMLLFLAVAIYSGYDVAAWYLKRHTLSAVMQIPMWTVYASVPIGCAFMFFQTTVRLLHQILKPTSDPMATQL